MIETILRGFKAVALILAYIVLGVGIALSMIAIIVDGATWARVALFAVVFVLLCFLVGKFIEADEELSR